MLPTVLAVLLVTVMAAVSELAGEREVLFPEIAAIAAGALVSPKLAWHTDDLRLFVSICLGSVIGLLVVLLPIPLYLQMPLAFLIASVMLALSGTTFAPMISSVVLPVMLGTRSVIYPVSAITLTAAVILLKKTMVHFGLRGRTGAAPLPLPDSRAISDLMIRWLEGSIVIAAAVLSGFRLAAAPPLLVAFTEFRRSPPKPRRAVMICVFIAVCAAAGSASRYIAIQLGAYSFIAAAAAVAAVFMLMRITGVYTPPAAALCILAFLIPESDLAAYPLLVTVGCAVFMGIAVIHGYIGDRH